MQEAIVEAKSKVFAENGLARWVAVTGPATAAVATASRIGWTFMSGRAILCDDGVVLDCLLDPPIVIAQAVKRALRRSRRLGNIAFLLPQLVPAAVDIFVARERVESLV